MKHIALKLFLLSYIIFTLSNCQTEEIRNISDYYYPLNELKEGLTYEYRVAEQASLAPDLWHYQSSKTDTSQYLLKAYYQGNYVNQVVREEVISNGVLLDQLRLFEKDSLGVNHQVNAEIISPNILPFEIEDEKMVFLYKVRFQMPSQPYGYTTLIINRRFLGDTTYQYEGRTYPAIRFDMRGQALVQDSINGDIEPRFWGEEIYAKGLGLVAYRRAFSPDERGLEYQLVSRYKK